jgi:hypothetical protein
VDREGPLGYTREGPIKMTLVIGHWSLVIGHIPSSGLRDPRVYGRGTRGLSTFGRTVAALAGLLCVFLQGASNSQEPAPSPPSAAASPKTPSVLAPRATATESPSADSGPVEPMERQPYRIVLHFGCHPSSRIDDARRADWLRDWQVLVRRFVGAPWSIAIAPASSPLLDLDLEDPDPSAFASVGAFDKVWIVHADRAEPGMGLALTGREYDVATRRLGPLQRRKVQTSGDAPRTLLEFALDLFSPTAVIAGQSGGDALLTVRGAMIEPSSPIGQVVSKGTVFQPLRLISTKKDGVVVRTIALTYLMVESVDGPTARCRITSAFRDPLTQRVAQANTLAAVGIKPGKSPLRLRFVTLPDKLPAAGYKLTARTVPDGQPRELGMTDRGGRIVLQPGFADGLVILRLLAGNIEPVRELPIMPGESSEERVIPFTPLPLTVRLEAQIDSLRDEVVDLVALRARLEARMEARLKGEDWTGLEEAIKEFGRLAPREAFSKKLTQLKDDAVREQTEGKKAILTKTAQAQITDLQATIDRYLDDESIKAYLEAISEKRSQLTEAEQARAKASAGKREAAAKPAPTETKVAQPQPKSTPVTPAKTKAVQPAAVSPPVPF